MAGSDRLEFRILGPLEARRDGEPVALGGPRQRALLALLLLHANEALSTDALIEGLWAEAPPATAVQTLQVYVWRLRKAVGAETLLRQGTGYAAAVEPGALDLDRFRALVAEARHEGAGRAAALLGEALALWHGTALADFVYEPFAHPHVERLEEERLTVLEERIELDLELGRHAALVPELEELVRAHPLRERARGQLMLALYRSGRQAEALETYQRGRELLVEELGIDPGPGLQELHRAILNQDPALSPAAVPTEPTPELPAPPTPLVGRRRELRELLDLAGRDDVRVLTVTGPGGVGKTRLAIELARALAGGRSDRVAFVPLAPLRDPGLVLPTVAGALGVQESGERPLRELVVERIGSRRTALVLDNLEQLLDAGPELAAVVERCPGLTVVATSRERLRLAAEHEYPLAPLAEDDAVELFSSRARMATGNAAADGDVAEICRRLDCLPLAIELAAARVKMLEPKAILARLGASLPLLTGGPRDAPERQRALRTTIDWSFELLPEAEAGLFCRLGVFAGGFTLEAAEAVADGDLDGVASLVDKSLLRQAGDSRFSMLQTVRQYALERLDGDDVRGRHARWALDLAERAEPLLRGSDQLEWLDRLSAEQDNFRDALEWSLGAEPQLALRLAAALAPYFEGRGHIQEGLGWLARALGGGVQPATREEARALYWTTRLAEKRGDVSQHEPLCERALTIFRGLDDRRGTVACLNQLARAAVERHELPAAEALCEESAALARSSGDAFALADSLTVLADVADQREDVERAVELETEALALRRTIGDTRGIGVSLNALAWALLLGRRYDEAIPYAAESAAVAAELGDRALEAFALGNLGLAALFAGDGERAEPSLRRSLSLAADLGLLVVVQEALHGLAGGAALRGSHERFARLSAAAAAVRKANAIEATPVERLIDERWMDEAQARLGAGALAAASLAGGRMSVEEAVADALGS